MGAGIREYGAGIREYAGGYREYGAGIRVAGIRVAGIRVAAREFGGASSPSFSSFFFPILLLVCAVSAPSFLHSLLPSLSLLVGGRNSIILCSL